MVLRSGRGRSTARALAFACATLPAIAASAPLAAVADLDPTNDWTIAPPEPLVDCEERLAAAGIHTRAARLPLRQQRAGFMCGAAQAVVYESGPEKVRYNAQPVVTCKMALALARFEQVLQEEAESAFGSRVVRIRQDGTYACRKMARYSFVSEHAYGNAIDLSRFALANGRVISVERHFGRPSDEPRTAEAKFLRRLARRLYDEDVFSVVLTPYFDILHRNHFHLDLARYRADGTR